MVGDTSYDDFDTQNSPCASVLNTNYVPSAAELAELRTLLLEPQQTLSGLEPEISRLQALLDERLSQRDRLKSYIDAHRALMSPIRQLPAETLADIFVNCLPTERHPVRSLKEAPLLLTTVCRSWRDIAINTPRLWNSLHIYIPSEMPTEALARREQGFNLWLSRSGSLPLFLSLTIVSEIRFLPSPEPRFPERYASFLRSLTKFSHRFDEIVLDLGPQELAALVSLAADGFPALKSFLVRRGGPYLQDDDQSYFAFPSMLALQKLRVLHFSVAPYTASAFHWENLTELFLEPLISKSLGPAEAFTILRQTVRLESCHIGVDIGGELTAIQSCDIHLPRLHTMSLIFTNIAPNLSPSEIRDGLSSVLHMLSCPSLKTLCVTLAARHAPTMTRSPFTLSWPSLERLRLQVAMTPEALTECLTLVPNLFVLELVDVGYYDNHISDDLPRDRETILKQHHLEALASSDVNNSLCPQLKVFGLWERTRRAIGFSDLELLEFLESKQRSAHKLDLCDMVLSPNLQNRDFPDVVTQRLRNLQENGLRLCVRYSNRYEHVPIEDTPTSGLSRLAHSSVIPSLRKIELEHHRHDELSTVIDNT